MLASTDDRMKVLDIIEECQSEARKTLKENAPAAGELSDWLSAHLFTPCIVTMSIFFLST